MKNRHKKHKRNKNKPSNLTTTPLPPSATKSYTARQMPSTSTTTTSSRAPPAKTQTKPTKPPSSKSRTTWTFTLTEMPDNSNTHCTAIPHTTFGDAFPNVSNVPLPTQSQWTIATNNCPTAMANPAYTTLPSTRK